MTLNSAIASGTGAISLVAQLALSQKAGISTGGSGSIDVNSVTASISMDDGSMTTAVNGNIRYAALGGLTLGALSTGGNVSLGASSISDSGSLDVDVSANALRIATTGMGAGDGAGTATSHLQIAVGTLAANVAGLGGLYLDETDAIVVDALASIGVARVNADGTTALVSDASMSDLVSGGNLVLVTGAGNITLNDGLVNGASVTAAGNLLLQAGGAASDLMVNASLLSSGGNISLDAGRDIVQNAAIGAAMAAKSVDLLAGGNITMANGTSLAANGGNILLQAGGNVTVELITAGGGSVGITATLGGIIDGDAAPAETEIDIVASSLQLSAAIGIGSGANALETTVGTLSAQTGAGGLFLIESDGLTVGAVTVQANRVGADGAATATLNAAQANFSSLAGGSLVLVTNTGDLLVNNIVSANGGGNILLRASTGALALNTAISSGTGSISLVAQTAIGQKAAITTAGGGSIDVHATAGGIAMDDGTVTTAVGGNIRYVAASTLTLGALSTGGSVSLGASSISDSGTTDLDVGASSLRIVTTGTGAGDGAGTATAHLQIAVGSLAANVAGMGGLYLAETDAIVVDALASIGVARVNADGSTALVSDASMSDLVSGGNLVLVTGAGGITLNDGIVNGTSVSAAGNLLLQAGGATSDIAVNAALLSTGGNISLNAGRDLLIGSSV
ncbi:beta strand repeat-containing protein, partial [Massilia glaciei]|uniref:beta strand repeat-containing protein n=1 Tax=Massilia glaciei TaxID=1524097 RepID=UPI001C63280C